MSSRYLSERRRIELLLPIRAFADVVSYGANDDAEKTQCLRYLEQARADALKYGEHVQPRVDKAYDRSFQRLYVDGIEVYEIGLAVYHWFKAVTDADYLVIGDGDFAKALDLILPAMQHAVEIAGVMDAARSRALWIGCQLQKINLYQAAPFERLLGSAVLSTRAAE